MTSKLTFTVCARPVAVRVAINFTYAKARYDIPCPKDNDVNVTFPGAVDDIPCAMDGKLA